MLKILSLFTQNTAFRDLNMNYADRKFGYCVIDWKIKNVCVTIGRSNWKVVSPDFNLRGAVPTKWKMALVPENEFDPLVELREVANPMVMLYLESFQDNEISCIDKVEVLLSIETGNTVVNASPIHKSFLKLKSGYWVKLGEINCMIPKEHSDFHPDDINLKCHLLVSFKNILETLEPCQDCNVKELSGHLYELLQRSYESDVLIGMNSHVMEAHKCILHNRSEYFAKKIDKSPDITDINIKSKYGFESLNKVIAFIYTGNLEFVLDDPSISIFMLADKFKLKDVIGYYEADKLDMCSEICCDEFRFTWTIKNFYRKLEPYFETSFTTGIGDISCKLRLNPRDVRNRKFATIFAEITGGNAEDDICIEFAVKSGKEHFCLEKTWKAFPEVKKIECMKIIRRSDLSKNEDLVLDIKFRISSGEYDSTLNKSEALCIDSNESSFGNLCMDMKLMYAESSFKDAVIHSNTGRVKVHKCILAVRSNYIYQEFKGRNFTELSIDDDLLEELLHFLYSSTCRNSEPPCHVLEGISDFSDSYLGGLNRNDSQIIH